MDLTPENPEVLRALAEQFGMEFIESIPPVSPEAIALLPAFLARQFVCFPLREEPKLAFAVSTPMDFEVLDSLIFLMRAGRDQIDFLVAPRPVIREAIDRYYGEVDLS